MRVDRNWHSKRRGMAGIVATVFMFAMLFTVGASYFLFVNQNNMLYNQAANARATANGDRQTESVTVVASADPNTAEISFTAQDLGAATTTIMSFFVLNSTGAVLAFCQAGSGGTCPTLPFSVNQGNVSSLVPTGITYVNPNVYTLTVVTQLGNVFTTTYPPSATSLASQALSSGAIGDLYLSFDSYTIYTVTDHPTTGACHPNSAGFSGFCFMTTSGYTGPGFAVPGATYANRYVGFSVSLTNLNAGQADIILDQWSLLYASVPASANSKVPLISWNIVAVGSPSGGLIPILDQYSPVVLPYNTPVTVYFAAANCVSASSGPDTGCQNVSYYGTTLARGVDFVQCPCSMGYPSASTIFILSNGWKLAAGTYTLSQLTYTPGPYGANYGQNTPFVSAVYY